MRRLVIVSNRTPSDGPPSAGGVAVALNEILKEQGGLWFGWSGQIAQTRSRTPKVCDRDRITFATVDLTEEDFASYYKGYANSVLWPVLHRRLDLADFDGGNSYRSYQSVNRYFASRLAPLLNPTDLVWIHDYHLIPLAAHLRQRGVTAATGFFLHVPVPPAEMIAALPEHREMFEALAAYDVIGFQTRRDWRNFMSYVREEAGLPVDGSNGTIEYRGRRILTGAFPIGTDPDTFARIAADRGAEKVINGSLERPDTRLLIGVDRLDYTKGLLHRVLAFERFLERAPDYRQRISLVQIAPPSREGIPEYAEANEALNSVCGRVNGAFSELDWQPIHYSRRALPQPQLASLYRASCVGLVTSLCDGMNLVAKEYVASQDPIDPGVLILSRFAGAAEQMEDALIVNPHDIEGLSSAIARALTMPIEERRARWVNLMSGLRDNTVFDWRDRFVDRLKSTAVRRDPEPATSRPRPAGVRLSDLQV